MSLFLFLLAAATLGIVVYVCRGISTMAFLKDVSLSDGNPTTSYSIVVAARNEAENLEAMVHGLCRQSYAAKEVVIVDDRSHDASPAVLEKLRSVYPRLKVVRIDHLPSGWLGKNHALWSGAQQVTGDYILFTDGDVNLSEHTMAKAMIYIGPSHALEHLAALPDVPCPSRILQVMMTYFSFCFWLAFRLWQVRDPESQAFAGIGAFNLVKRDTYFSLGGHQVIALRPDDDLMLGKLFKEGTRRSEIVLGKSEVVVAWYKSLGEMVRGLEKNVFSGFDYRLSLASLGLLGTLAWHAAPFFLWMCLGRSWNAAWLMLTALSLCAGAAYANAKLGYPRKYALTMPLGAIIFFYIAVRAIIKNIKDGGIYWRDTFYTLKELKTNPRNSIGPRQR